MGLWKVAVGLCERLPERSKELDTVRASESPALRSGISLAAVGIAGDDAYVYVEWVGKRFWYLGKLILIYADSRCRLESQNYAAMMTFRTCRSATTPRHFRFRLNCKSGFHMSRTLHVAASSVHVHFTRASNTCEFGRYCICSDHDRLLYV